MKKLNLKTVVALALLTAAEVTVSRFLSLNMQSMKFGISFIFVVLAAREYGTAGGALVGGLGDLLGALLFPFGPYFPGFTVTAALRGALYAFIFKKGFSFRRLVAVVLINQFVIGMLVDSAFISVLYGTPYLSLLPLRALQGVIMSIVSIALIYVTDKAVPKLNRNI